LFFCCFYKFLQEGKSGKLIFFLENSKKNSHSGFGHSGA